MQLCKMMINKNKISDVNICGILKSNREPQVGEHAYQTQARGRLKLPSLSDATLAGEVAQLT